MDGSSRWPPECTTQHRIVEEKHRRATVRAGRSPRGRSQLVEQTLLGDDIEAVAEAYRRVAGDQGGEAVAAFFHSGVALVEAFDEFSEKTLGVRVRGGQRHRRAANRPRTKRLDAETAS